MDLVGLLGVAIRHAHLPDPRKGAPAVCAHGGSRYCQHACDSAVLSSFLRFSAFSPFSLRRIPLHTCRRKSCESAINSRAVAAAAGTRLETVLCCGVTRRTRCATASTKSRKPG